MTSIRPEFDGSRHHRFGIVRREAEVAEFALLLEHLVGAQKFLVRENLGIGHVVQHGDVNVLETEPLEAGVETLDDVLSGDGGSQPVHVLGDHDDLVAPVLECLADGTFVLAGVVLLGRIDEVDAAVESVVAEPKPRSRRRG